MRQHRDARPLWQVQVQPGGHVLSDGDGAAEHPVDVRGDVGRIGATRTVLRGEAQDGRRLAFVPVGQLCEGHLAASGVLDHRGSCRGVLRERPLCHERDPPRRRARSRAHPGIGPELIKKVAGPDSRQPGKLLDCPGLAIKAAVMTSRISHTSFDARNAYAQSVFWSQVLDFTEDPDDPNKPEHQECLIMSRDRSQMLLFITVPDRKTVKNRVHLDLRPADRTREQETERIVALGASRSADHRRPDGSGWITLADPEGNEFCILSREPAGPGATT